MRLYPKKLRNVEDLKREKQKLLKESRQLDKEDFLSLDGILGKGKTDKDGNDAAGIGSLLDLLPVSNPLVSLGVKMAGKLLSGKGKSKEKDRDRAEPVRGDKEDKSWIKSIAVEFIGGYLKWKAIELSFNGIKHLIKKRKDKQ